MQKKILVIIAFTMVFYNTNVLAAAAFQQETAENELSEDILTSNSEVYTNTSDSAIEEENNTEESSINIEESNDKNNDEESNGSSGSSAGAGDISTETTSEEETDTEESTEYNTEESTETESNDSIASGGAVSSGSGGGGGFNEADSAAENISDESSDEENEESEESAESTDFDIETENNGDEELVSDTALEALEETAFQTEDIDNAAEKTSEESTEETTETVTEEETEETTQEEQLSALAENIIYNVALPTSANAYLDPENASGRGNIFSSTYKVVNYGNTDVVLKIKNIDVVYKFTQALVELSDEEVSEDYSDTKKINIEMVWNNKHENIENEISITEGESNEAVILLKAAQYDDEGNFSELNEGSVGEFYFTGTMNSKSIYDWASSEFSISFDFEILSSDEAEEENEEEESGEYLQGSDIISEEKYEQAAY